MKATCTLIASVAAASTVAFSSSGGSAHAFNNSSIEGLKCDSRKGEDIRDSNVSVSSRKEKFAPKFDGLKFIETLVTAHR